MIKNYISVKMVKAEPCKAWKDFRLPDNICPSHYNRRRSHRPPVQMYRTPPTLPAPADSDNSTMPDLTFSDDLPDACPHPASICQ